MPKKQAKKAGRPPSKDGPAVMISLRMRPDAKAALVSRAKAWGLSQSETVAELLRRVDE